MSQKTPLLDATNTYIMLAPSTIEVLSAGVQCLPTTHRPCPPPGHTGMPLSTAPAVVAGHRGGQGADTLRAVPAHRPLRPPHHPSPIVSTAPPAAHRPTNFRRPAPAGHTPARRLVVPLCWQPHPTVTQHSGRLAWEPPGHMIVATHIQASFEYTLASSDSAQLAYEST